MYILKSLLLGSSIIEIVQQMFSFINGNFNKFLSPLMNQLMLVEEQQLIYYLVFIMKLNLLKLNIWLLLTVSTTIAIIAISVELSMDIELVITVV